MLGEKSYLVQLTEDTFATFSNAAAQLSATVEPIKMACDVSSLSFTTASTFNERKLKNYVVINHRASPCMLLLSEACNLRSNFGHFAMGFHS
ncbi:hypothetical protein NPIL_506211 [Nephila pilipes]|uniref:Uncharacterized protein n=1 Tax=Nephila pilipes TaxID=299642 RepID=A0A8X6MG76_NEPPI|nr:hypothetical protein NPIL_506211 [Nephila pilipes]